MSRLTGERTRPVVHRIQTAKSPPVDAERKHFADALTARIAAAKRRLTAGGMLRSVQWMRRTGEKDVRGRQAVSVTLLDAFIQERPGLDRSRIDTDRADTTVLTILEPLAVSDTDTFRWGDPPHTYSVKSIDGVIQNESTGTRYASEVTVIR